MKSDIPDGNDCSNNTRKNVVACSNTIYTDERQYYNGRWKAFVSFGTSDDHDDSTIFMTNFRLIEPEPTRENVWLNKCVPYIWPRTWTQAYMTGVLDLVFAWLLYFCFVAKADKAWHLFAIMAFMFAIMAFMLSGCLYFTCRVFAWTGWREDQEFARNWMNPDSEKAALLKNDEETVKPTGDVKVLTLSEYDSWPVFEWPAHAYFAGLLELIVWVAIMPHIQAVVCNERPQLRFEQWGFLLPLAWILGRILTGWYCTKTKKRQIFYIHRE